MQNTMQGLRGSGTPGPKGDAGERGEIGFSGERGLPGTKGERGDHGLTGGKGDRVSNDFLDVFNIGENCVSVYMCLW